MSFFASDKAGILAWLRLAFWEEHWSIGLVDREAFWRCVKSGTLSDEEVHWLRSSKAFFLADPCWISEAERLIAAECFHYRRRIGQIILVRESGSRAVSIRTIRASEFHHSFPMVYTFNDACLIIPESAAANQVCAISINSNGKVISEIAILTGCQLVDPIVFCHDGSYWMFANPLHNFDNELVVFRGDSAVGPWHATALWFLPIPNCRGAGRIFEQDGVLYWPTQFNTRRYGGGVILRRHARVRRALGVGERDGGQRRHGGKAGED